MSSGRNSFIDEIAREALGGQFVSGRWSSSRCRSRQMTSESVRRKCDACFTKPRKRGGKKCFIHFSTERLTFVSWNLPHCVPPGSSERDWPVRPNHSIVLPFFLPPSLPPFLHLSLSVRYFITGRHTDPNIDGDIFFFPLSHLGQGEWVKDC